MTGPPTPPPSSATEMKDAARTTLPPLATQPPATDPATDPPEQLQPPIVTQNIPRTSYEHIFPGLSELVRSGLVRDLIQLAERADLSAENDKDSSRLLVVAPLVLAYLIDDKLPPARYALTRLPENLRSTPLIQSLFALVASVSERKYAHIYRRAEELSQSVQQSNFPNAALGAILAGMLAAFVESFQKKTFTLLARAYTSIPLALAQVYLGVTPDQVVNAAVSTGWEFHEANHLLTPPKRTTSGSTRIVNSIPTTLAALNLVTDSIANLES